MLIGNTNRLSLIIKDSDTRCEIIDEASVCEAKLDAGSDTRQVVRMYKQIAATSCTAYEQVLTSSYVPNDSSPCGRIIS